MKWFHGMNDLESLRKEYKRLVIRHHPDNGGLEEDIKEINAEYDLLFQRFKDGYEHSESYKDATERQKQAYDPVKDRKLREVIISLSRYPGLVIELCGVWLWVSGDTKTYKNELKALGLHYAGNKKCWYIHFDDHVRYGKKPSSMSYIRQRYGSAIIYTKQEDRERIKG